jgi:hypothetical protein
MNNECRALKQQNQTNKSKKLEVQRSEQTEQKEAFHLAFHWLELSITVRIS